MTGHGGTGCGLPYIYIFYHAVPCLFVNTCRVCLTHITFYCRRKEKKRIHTRATNTRGGGATRRTGGGGEYIKSVLSPSSIASKNAVGR